MNISQKMIAAAGMVLMTVVTAPAHAMDWNALGADLQAASDFLAMQRWGSKTPPPAHAYPGQQIQPVSARTVTRNESVSAAAGIPQLLGVRWAVDRHCNSRPVDIHVTQPPRFGQIVVHKVPYTVPATAAIGSTSRCAGRPITGYAIYYRAPQGQGHYYDHVAVRAVSKNGTLSFNYRIQVEKPFG